MKLWLKLKIFLTFKWRFSSFIQIEVSRSYKISYIIGATGSDRKQKPVQYFHFFFNQMIWEQLWWIQVRKFENIMVVILFLSLGALKTSILGPKLGSFLVQFFFDDYSFFMKKAIFFFVLHEELKTEENATSNQDQVLTKLAHDGDVSLSFFQCRIS